MDDVIAFARFLLFDFIPGNPSTVIAVTAAVATPIYLAAFAAFVLTVKKVGQEASWH